MSLCTELLLLQHVYIVAGNIILLNMLIDKSQPSRPTTARQPASPCRGDTSSYQ